MILILSFIAVRKSSNLSGLLSHSEGVRFVENNTASSKYLTNVLNLNILLFIIVQSLKKRPYGRLCMFWQISSISGKTPILQLPT